MPGFFQRGKPRQQWTGSCSVYREKTYLHLFTAPSQNSIYFCQLLIGAKMIDETIEYKHLILDVIFADDQKTIKSILSIVSVFSLM